VSAIVLYSCDRSDLILRMFSAAFKSFSSNIAANYEIGKSPVATSGAWTIFDGKKKSTGTAVSIFVFDRKSLDIGTSGGFGARTSATSIRKVQDEIVERLKKEASSLARLRHPSILQLVEPVEDTRNGGLMFAAEPVTASLAGLLAEKDQQEGAAGSGGRQRSRFVIEDADGTRRRREVEMDELEIQKGLLQVSKGLEFLHESAGLVHGNLTPEAIYVNEKSDWKISGLSFAGPPDGAEGHQSLPPIPLSEVLYHDHRLPQSVQLNLDYTSPDFVLDNNVTPSADVFSLGLVIVALYNSPHTSPIQTSGNQTTYKRVFGTESTTPSARNEFLSSRPLPRELKQTLPQLLARRPAQRISAGEFQQSAYFDNILVNTIRFLDALPAKTLSEKAQFMRGLGRVMPQFPASVLGKKVLLALLDEMKDKELLSLVLQNIFKIVKAIPSGRRVFPEKVLPILREVFLTKSSGQERDTSKEAGLMVIIENMDLVVENCSGKEFKDDVLPIVNLAMESSTHSLVDATLKRLAVVLPVLDFSTVKHDLFPCVAAVFSKTSSLGIKVSGLEALLTLCGGTPEEQALTKDDLSGVLREEKKPKASIGTALDKYTVQEKVVPLIKAIKTKEPAVMMATLHLLRQIGKIADTDFLALDVLPILWSFSLGPLLDLQQFKSFMDLIKALSSRIEREQTRKLQELSATNRSSDSRSGDASSRKTNGFDGSNISSANEDDFERLVLGKPAQAAPKPTTQVPAFSWSSTTLQNNPASRPITPDTTLSAFPSLQPASNRATLDPSPTPWTTQRTVSNSSMTTMTTSAGFPNPTTISSNRLPHPLNQNQNHPPSFTIPPPPPPLSTSSNPLSNQTRLTGSQQFMPPPPPPPAPNAGPNQTWNQPQYGVGLNGPTPAQQQPSNQSAQKSGLDKYQSLL
jgi:SCY1-like protein 2